MKINIILAATAAALIIYQNHLLVKMTDINTELLDAAEVQQAVPCQNPSENINRTLTAAAQ